MPSNEDLPVGLNGDLPAIALPPLDEGGDHAGTVEAGVQRAVGVVAGTRAKSIIGPVVAIARHQDLAVGLHGNASKPLVIARARNGGGCDCRRR